MTPTGARTTAFEDRSVKLETTFDGAGVLTGDLTPECASIVTTVLDALSAPAGAEDTRSQAQRYHDGLHEAMRRLVTAGLLPERAGQPVKAWVHISLADLMVLDGSSALQEEWAGRVRAAWAAHRAGASAGGSDGGAWLDGGAAQAAACDAAVAPVVTGEVNSAVLEDLVRLCIELGRLRRHGAGDDAGRPAPASDGAGAPQAARRPRHDRGPGRPWSRPSSARPSTCCPVRAGWRRSCGACSSVPGWRPSLPLDVGYAETIPAGIRNAVTLRDKHCRWAGGCSQPAAACQVHHVRHKANGGKTSTRASGTGSSITGCDPPVGLDAGPEPGRDHHRVEPGQDEDPAQPQPPSQHRVTSPVSGATGFERAGLTAMGQDSQRADAKVRPLPGHLWTR